MQKPLYIHEWLGVDLTLLPAARRPDAQADCELYPQFYQALEARGGPDQAWAVNKSSLGREIAKQVLQPWASRAGSFRILSLGVGTGLTEREWLKQGYDVTLHECQEFSLRSLLADFPATPYIILKTAVGTPPDGVPPQPQVFAEMTVVTHWVKCAAVENSGRSRNCPKR